MEISITYIETFYVRCHWARFIFSIVIMLCGVSKYKMIGKDSVSIVVIFSIGGTVWQIL